MIDGEVFEPLVRGVAVGGFVAIALAVGRGGHTPARITGALFCLSAAAHALGKVAPVGGIFGIAWIPVWIFTVTGAGLFWAFANELFNDRQRLAGSRLVPAGALLVLGMAAEWTAEPTKTRLWLLHDAAGSALMILVLIIVAAEWRGDLVEPRRRMRGPIIAAGAVYVILLTGVDFAEVIGRPSPAFSIWDAVLLMALGLWSCAAFLHTDPLLFGTTRAIASEPSGGVPPEDQPLLAQLLEAMDVAEVWKREDLGIRDLAQVLKAPEHRVRRLINERLGYRNFNTFLNERRIAASQQMLSDPGNARKPVSSIAFATGFASLGPFNRAFKAATGETPTEWRRRVLSTSPSPKNIA